MQIDEVSDVHFAALSAGALTVEIPQDFSGTADVEVTVDTPAYPHPAVHRRRHQ